MSLDDGGWEVFRAPKHGVAFSERYHNSEQRPTCIYPAEFHAIGAEYVEVDDESRESDLTGSQSAMSATELDSGVHGDSGSLDQSDVPVSTSKSRGWVSFSRRGPTSALAGMELDSGVHGESGSLDQSDMTESITKLRGWVSFSRRGARRVFADELGGLSPVASALSPETPVWRREISPKGLMGDTPSDRVGDTPKSCMIDTPKDSMGDTPSDSVGDTPAHSGVWRRQLSPRERLFEIKNRIESHADEMNTSAYQSNGNILLAPAAPSEEDTTSPQSDACDYSTMVEANTQLSMSIQLLCRAEEDGALFEDFKGRHLQEVRMASGKLLRELNETAQRVRRACSEGDDDDLSHNHTLPSSSPNVSQNQPPTYVCVCGSDERKCGERELTQLKERLTDVRRVLEKEKGLRRRVQQQLVGLRSQVLCLKMV